MGRSHKKGGGGGGSSGKKKKQLHHKRKQAQQQANTHDATDPTDTTGWTQEDFQHREQARQRANLTSADDEIAAPPVLPPARSVSSSRKKRKHTPAWMLDPYDPLPASCGAGVSSSAAAAASSASSAAPCLSSTCWNSLPRDCMLHVFSFFDLFAIARLTGTSHFWYACLRRGVMARVLEQSWRILRQKPVQIAAAAVAGGNQTHKESEDGAGAAPIPAAAVSTGWRSLSETISPAMIASAPSRTVQSLDSEESPPPAAAVVRSSLTPAVSPSLSALPPAAALQAMSALSLPSSAAASAAASSSSSSVAAPTSFRSSVLHLRSLYAGQKNLAYSLLSNPLWQHLQIVYHLSWSHERVLEVVAQMHVALFRAKHKGKWPRSTKKEAAASNNSGASSAASSSSTPDSALASDLMPLHLVLDSAVMHRASFLGSLQRGPHKHLHDFLHARPVITHFGFDGNSLPRVQMLRMLRSMEAKLESNLAPATAATAAAGAQLKQSNTAKGRYHGKSRAVAASPSDFVLDPATGCVLLSNPADLPCHFLPPSSSPSGAAGLVSSAEAEAVAATLRRMERLCEIWGKSLHSSSTNAQPQQPPASNSTTEAADAAASRSSDASSSTAATAALSATLKSSSSSLDREWDELALLWLSQHQRIRLLHAFWSRLAQLLHDRERKSLMNDIVAAAASVPGIAVHLSQASVLPESGMEDD